MIAPTLTKLDRPLLRPEPGLVFRCPVTRQPVAWAAKDVFNPGATLHDGAVGLLVRAEDAGERLEAVRLTGRYWMYWGEGLLFAATSVDGIAWEPVEHPTGHARVVRLRDGNWRDRAMPDGGVTLLPVMRPRPNRFDAQLVEPGPAAVLDGDVITLWYNGSRPGADAGRYSTGIVAFDAEEPTSVVSRGTRPVLEPDRAWEASGQNAAVVFATGLVRWRGRELLYYGCADSRVGAAIVT